MVNIKSLSIKGFRGVKEELFLECPSKSVLLFGRNGSGKSSITDAVEWFYKDSIKHLLGEEIGKRGQTALRNIFIEDSQKSLVNINFTDDNFKSKKTIQLRDSKLEVENSNDSEAFKEYIEKSKNENLILRYGDFTSFILSTKKEKLDSLSSIIGFDKISAIRKILQKSVNDIKNILRSKDFDNSISIKDGQIIEELGERIVSDEQYIRKINEIIRPFELGMVIASIEDIDKLLANFKSDNSEIVEKRLYYKDVFEKANALEIKFRELIVLYEEYSQSFQGITRNVEVLRGMALGKLWSEGLNVLRGDITEKDECPLCLQPKSREELKEEIGKRLTALGEVEDQKTEFERIKQKVKSLIAEINNVFSSMENNKFYKLEENGAIQAFLKYSKEYISVLKGELEIDIFKRRVLKSKDELAFNNATVKELAELCRTRDESLGEQIKEDKTSEIHRKIIFSRRDYDEVNKLKREKKILEEQQCSLERIYNAFVKTQKKEIEDFIDTYSEEINEFYTYMHPGEKVDNIKLKTLEKQDELTGITIDFSFFNEDNASPPQKYLSESHLNSLGIAFFLASVKAFNKRNKFFVLDDIISSFDSEHRKAISDLLFDKFSDYQIIILTHEKNWFDYMKNVVRGKADWTVNVINWNECKGTHLDEKLIDLKSMILKRFEDNENAGLGNLIRQYLEKLLKEICEKIEVPLKFCSNDFNEKRMNSELLSGLKGKINKQPSKAEFESAISRLMSSSFIANEGSHNGSFEPSIGDCRAFWQEVENFQKLFCCEDCNKTISRKDYDNIGKRIRACEHLSYDWMV